MQGEVAMHGCTREKETNSSSSSRSSSTKSSTKSSTRSNPLELLPAETTLCALQQQALQLGPQGMRESGARLQMEAMHAEQERLYQSTVNPSGLEEPREHLDQLCQLIVWGVWLRQQQSSSSSSSGSNSNRSSSSNSSNISSSSSSSSSSGSGSGSTIAKV
jgi:hypothetical protein